MKLILIHGLGQTPASWDNTADCLTAKAEVICPELSELFASGEYTYSSLYKGFSDYCGSLSEPVSLCGLSLGAVLALNYAADYPQKVRSLTLIAAQYRTPKLLFKLQSVIFRFMPERAFNDIGFTKKNFIELNESMTRLDLSGKLSEISCPVLILCGENDKTNLKAARELSEKLKKSKFIVVRGAGHEVNIDKSKRLAGLINKFLNTL